MASNVATNYDDHSMNANCIGEQFPITDVQPKLPFQKTSVEAADARAWLKEQEDNYPIRILSKRVDNLRSNTGVTSEYAPLFSANIVDDILDKTKIEYSRLVSNDGGGSFTYTAYPPQRFVLQTPNDDGPGCSIVLMSHGRGAVRGFYCFTGEPEFDPSALMAGMTVYSGWRSNAFHIVVLPVAFLGAHVSYLSQQLTQLGRKISEIENVLSAPRDLDDHSLNFAYMTRQLHECNSKLIHLERRARFQQGIVRCIEENIVRAERERMSVIDAIRGPLEVHKNAIITQNYEFEILPKRIESQRTTIFNLVVQRDQRLALQVGHANLEIAETSRKIAEASMVDSASMKTIAILTMIFLPGTAIASFFSMTMFNWNTPGQPVTSGYLWIYFVVSIPLTVMVLLVWYVFLRRRRASRLAKTRTTSFPLTISSGNAVESSIGIADGSKREDTALAYELLGRQSTGR